MNCYKTVLVLFLLHASSFVWATDEIPKWITEGPYVSEDSISLSLPVEVFASLLLIEVELGGAPRRFLFDTGSPSMINADLAAELGLEVIDQRTGRDSHGKIVETDIVQADLALGGTIFHNVPVFVTDFPKAQRCLFDGVLGSEVLPLCAWQIDLPESVLRCNSAVEKLGHIEEATKQPLYNSGYPHAPILDIQLAKNAVSKALFDTGSPEYFAISPPDLKGARRNGGVGKTISGIGSMGTSMGGRAPNRDQLLVQLRALKIGKDANSIQLKRTDATLRESSPSLVGASVLQHFIVTLDSKNSGIYFDQFRDGPYARSSYGFGLDFDESVSISLVWNDSAAAAAGLHVGQRVTSINGRPTDTSCDGIRRAMRAMSSGNVIDLEWEGGSAKLARDSSL